MFNHVLDLLYYITILLYYYITIGHMMDILFGSMVKIINKSSDTYFDLYHHFNNLSMNSTCVFTNNYVIHGL